MTRWVRAVGVLLAAACVTTGCEPFHEPSSVTKHVAAVDGARVALGKAWIDIPAACLAYDTDVTVRRTEAGPTGDTAYAFSTEEAALCRGRVRIQLPVKNAPRPGAAAAAFESAGAWHVVRATYDVHDHVLRAQVDHLSVWAPVDLAEPLLKWVRDRLLGSLGIRATPPVCRGPRLARTRVTGGSVTSKDPPLYVCMMLASDHSLRLSVVNNRTYAVRVRLPRGVRVVRRTTSGSLAERALRVYSRETGGVYVQAGSRIDLRATRRGAALRVRFAADVPASVVSLVADAAGFVVGGGVSLVTAGVAIADCARDVRAWLGSGSATKVARAVVRCLGAVAGVSGRAGEGVRLSLLGRALRVGRTLLKAATLALDVVPLADIIADHLRFHSPSAFTVTRPPLPRPKPRVSPAPGSKLTRSGSGDTTPFVDLCCGCSCA